MSAMLAIGLAVVASFALRIVFIVLVPAGRLPASVQGAFDDVAPAVLAALAVTALTGGSGVSGLLTPPVAAGFVAAVVAWHTRNLAATVAAGVGAMALLQLL
jgi:branched-subunit amino acid transport protein